MLGVSIWVWVVAVPMAAVCVLIIIGGSLRDDPALLPPERRDTPDADGGDGIEVDF